MSSKPLSVQDFKRDYQFMVVRYDSRAERRLRALDVIDQHYSHCAKQCIKALNEMDPR